MHLLFVMDPAARMAPDKDTSFAWMLGARARGHQCWHTEPRELSFAGDRLVARARTITVSREPPHVELGVDQELAVDEVDAILVRKDPPFDVAYLHLTQLLDLVSRRVSVINEPRGLRDANEKLFTLRFAHHMPRTVVSADPGFLLSRLGELGGRGVAKPLDGAGGVGVVPVDLAGGGARAVFDWMTREGREAVMLQEFLPAVRAGDKRVLLLGGRSLGAILRIPREDDFRANIHVGGSVVPTELTPAEAAIVDDVAPVLLDHGLSFVGLDLVGERLTEINVTSPTGLQELGRFLGRAVEQDAVAWLEEQVRGRRASLAPEAP